MARTLALNFQQLDLAGLHASHLVQTGNVTSEAPGVVQLAEAASMLSPGGSDQELLDAVAAYYHLTLQRSSGGQSYLASLGLADPELIKVQHLGIANRTLCRLLPPMHMKAGSAIRRRLQRLGILRESGHEHLNGRLIVPVLDGGCHVRELHGYQMFSGGKSSTCLHLSWSKESLWNMVGATEISDVIVTEFPFEAMAFWCAGLHHATATFGDDGRHSALVEGLCRLGIRRVFLAFGRSAASERGVSGLSESLRRRSVECYRVLCPQDMGVIQYALKFAPSSQSLPRLVRQAVWLGKAPQRGQAQLSRDTPSLPDVPAPESGAGLRTSGNSGRLADTPDAPSGHETTLAKVAKQVGSTTSDVDVLVEKDELEISLGTRCWRVRGVAKNLGYATLRVTVFISLGEKYYVDNFDLYVARARSQFIAQAAKELFIGEDVVKHDLGRVLIKVESAQDAHIQSTLKVDSSLPRMSQADTEQALELLKRPDLLAGIVADLEICGLIGEDANKTMAYLAATSRKLAQPLSVVVQSSSSTGKTALMNAVLDFMPEEDCVKLSCASSQSLYYMGQSGLTHKILAFAGESGFCRATYALKLLLSDGELSITSTGKDPNTGRLASQRHQVQGPVAIMLTTTAIELDGELLNRCVVLSVNEGREQTRAIQGLQRAMHTLAGLKAAKNRAQVIHLHQNAQRLLRPLLVVNPFAEQLTFQSDNVRARRDQEKYLTLIDAIALLHQYQRPIKSLPGDPSLNYIEVIPQDIVQAHALAHEVMGHSLDELPPQTRRLLAAIVKYARERMRSKAVSLADMRFTRREARAFADCGDTQLRVHLTRLVLLEYLTIHRQATTGRLSYELTFDGEVSADVCLSGLIDAAKVSSLTTPLNLPAERRSVSQVLPRADML